MPRQARAIENGSYYHVITRGNNKKAIFNGKRDYVHFKKIVIEELSRHRLTIYHYCLMINHVHFLIRADEAPDVPKFFSHTLQRYAYYFRKRYGHTGYLFQNRYKSILIDKESYLLECARYIERNPIRAGIAESLDRYEWSSYLHYAFRSNDNIVGKDDPVYEELAGKEEERRSLYIDFINQEKPYDDIVAKELS